MSDRKRWTCEECGHEVWWNSAAVQYQHVDDRRNDHLPVVLTHSYLDSPGMRQAHLRSMGR